MSQGKILQVGAPQELYNHPSSRTVGAFLGAMNEFEGSLSSDGSIRIQLGVLDCEVPVGLPQRVTVAIRPEDVEVSAAPRHSTNEFYAELVSRLFLGDMTVCGISSNGTRLRGKLTTIDPSVQVGSKIYIRLPPDKLKVSPN